MTPSLEHKVGDILDEIKHAFEDEIGTSTGNFFPIFCRDYSDTPSEWKSFTAAMKAHRIATRTANRVLVGAPLCRNEEYLQMSIRYTIDVFGGADKLRKYPEFLRGLMSKLVTRVAEQQKIARKHLIPYIEERLAKQSKADEGKGSDSKPSDSLQWVMDAAPNDLERDPQRLLLRLLHINVAAVHTTSVTFLNCLFDLALHPEIHEELRQEIKENVASFGWTKKTLLNLKKLDSFMLESQRLAPIASCKCL